MLCGGEALSAELAAPLLARGESLWNMYGPTETTIWSSVARVVDAGPTCRSAGRSRTRRCYVLDARREPVPIGVPGELYIGGAGVARGYLGRAGADRGAVRRRSVRARASARDVPHGRSRALARRRRARVPRPHRPPGEGARLPHRAGRDRARARAAREVREAVVVVRERRPATRGWWRTSSRAARRAPSVRRAARRAATRAARLHGAGAVRRARRAAAHAERQDRPRARCPRPTRRARRRAAGDVAPRTPLEAADRRGVARACSACGRSASRTTSSRSAAIRCSRCASWRDWPACCRRA